MKRKKKKMIYTIKKQNGPLVYVTDFGGQYPFEKVSKELATYFDKETPLRDEFIGFTCDVTGQSDGGVVSFKSSDIMTEWLELEEMVLTRPLNDENVKDFPTVIHLFRETDEFGMVSWTAFKYNNVDSFIVNHSDWLQKLLQKPSGFDEELFRMVNRFEANTYLRVWFASGYKKLEK